MGAGARLWPQPLGPPRGRFVSMSHSVMAQPSPETLLAPRPASTRRSPLRSVERTGKRAWLWPGTVHFNEGEMQHKLVAMHPPCLTMRAARSISA